MAKTDNGQGTYGIPQMFSDFYNYKPGEGDESGRRMKYAVKGNAMQSVLDSQLAQQLGQFNQGLAQENMNHQADLEQRNQSA